MKSHITLMAIGAGAIALAVAATAQSDSQIVDGEFTNITLQGGGNIKIQHGDTFRFEDTGGSGDWKLEVKKSTLYLGCERPCRGRGREATITIPVLEGTAIQGGGRIVLSGNFPDVDEFDVAIQGGGQIDADAVTGDEVNAAIQGGGEIFVAATSELNASIMGGGRIAYDGDPKVNKAVMGGGKVVKQ